MNRYLDPIIARWNWYSSKSRGMLIIQTLTKSLQSQFFCPFQCLVAENGRIREIYKIFNRTTPQYFMLV